MTGYSGLFVFCAVSGILVPVPEDIPLIYAGMRVASSEWAWIPVLAAALSGVFVRDMLAFGMGRWLGERLLTEGNRVALWIGPQKLARARRMFDRHDVGAIFLGRLFVGFRAPVFLVAGALGVPVRRFAVWNMAGLVLTVPAILVLGYVFGQPIADFAFLVSRRGREVILTLLVLSIVWFIWSRQRSIASGS
jgi:membrane protein DedA with SNARE-associated domain